MWVRLDTDRLEPDPFDTRTTAGRHEQSLSSYRGPVREPQDVVAAVARGLRGLDSEVQLDPVPPQCLGQSHAEGGRLSWDQPIGALDEHGLTTEPPYHLCDLDTGRATAEHDEAAGNRLHGRRFARAPHADQAVEPRNGWHERIRARRYDDMLRRVASAVHVDHAGPGEPAHAPDQRDAPIRQPFLLSRIRIAGHHVVPPVQRRLHVHLGAGADVAGALDRLPRTQEGLGRDARPVGALAADQLPLDDGDPKPTRRDGPGAVLAGRTAAQHDHVEIAHAGSS